MNLAQYWIILQNLSLPSKLIGDARKKCTCLIEERNLFVDFHFNY